MGEFGKLKCKKCATEVIIEKSCAQKLNLKFGFFRCPVCKKKYFTMYDKKNKIIKIINQT